MRGCVGGGVGQECDPRLLGGLSATPRRHTLYVGTAQVAQVSRRRPDIRVDKNTRVIITDVTAQATMIRRGHLAPRGPLARGSA